MPGAADVAGVEAGVRRILEPFGDRLERGSVYGMETLTRPGTSKHDFFVGIQPAKSFVSLHVKPLYDRPDLLAGAQPALRKALKGRIAFNFTSLDEELAADLGRLLDRAYAVYAAEETESSWWQTCRPSTIGSARSCCATATRWP